MDQVTLRRVQQQEPRRCPDGEGEEIAEGEPLDGGDPAVGGGEGGVDLDGGGSVRDLEEEDQGPGGAGKREGGVVEGGEEGGSVGEPPLPLAGADRLELVAGDGADGDQVAVPPGHGEGIWGRCLCHWLCVDGKKNRERERLGIFLFSFTDRKSVV